MRLQARAQDQGPGDLSLPPTSLLPASPARARAHEREPAAAGARAGGGVRGRTGQALGAAVGGNGLAPRSRRRGLGFSPSGAAVATSLGPAGRGRRR
jgi:hypothetical protein